MDLSGLAAAILSKGQRAQHMQCSQVLPSHVRLLLKVAERCMWRAKDLSGLLLLYSAKGSVDGMQKLVDLSKEQGKQNVAFLGLFLLGKLDECIDLLISSGRTPEAAFFARTYMPSRVTEVGCPTLLKLV